MIDKLPGCITVTSGPQDATEADMTCGAGQTSVRESLEGLNSTLGTGTNLTGGASTLIPKVSVATASGALPSANKASASVEAMPASQADDEDDDVTTKNRRSLPKGRPLEAGSDYLEERSSTHEVDPDDEYGSYTYQFPPTVTSHRPEVPYDSPAPRRHSKRAMPHKVVPEDESGSYNFELPPTVASHRPWIPHGSPAPQRRWNGHRVTVKKIKTG